MRDIKSCLDKEKKNFDGGFYKTGKVCIAFRVRILSVYVLARREAGRRQEEGEGISVRLVRGTCFGKRGIPRVWEVLYVASKDVREADETVWKDFENRKKKGQVCDSSGRLQGRALGKEKQDGGSLATS